MSSAKLAIGCGFAAIALSACGTQVNPIAGSIGPSATSAGRAKIDDPRTKRFECMRQDKLPVSEFGHVWIQIGSPPAGPQVYFAATPGAAQWLQIDGQAPAGEVIGSAVLYPNQGSDQLLSAVETCLAEGVKG
jgi:hypothetical protein